MGSFGPGWVRLVLDIGEEPITILLEREEGKP